MRFLHSFPSIPSTLHSEMYSLIIANNIFSDYYFEHSIIINSVKNSTNCAGSPPIMAVSILLSSHLKRWSFTMKKWQSIMLLSMSLINYWQGCRILSILRILHILALKTKFLRSISRCQPLRPLLVFDTNPRHWLVNHPLIRD